MAESLRAVFAAFLWHEGIVHDAMTCASFLKFYPSLPKKGALVTKRTTERYACIYVGFEVTSNEVEVVRWNLYRGVVFVTVFFVV